MLLSSVDFFCNAGDAGYKLTTLPVALCSFVFFSEFLREDLVVCNIGTLDCPVRRRVRSIELRSQ